MKTLYNIELKVERPKDITDSQYKGCVKAFYNAGLLGKKHIKENGVVKEGFDEKVDLVHHAHFDIFLRDNTGPNMDQITEKLKMKSLFMLGEKYKELQSITSVLEFVNENFFGNDPGYYIQAATTYMAPTITTMSIMTPVGKQSLHCHYDNNPDFLRFWKPKWGWKTYDWDVFKDNLWIGIIDEEKNDSLIKKVGSAYKKMMLKRYFPLIVNSDYKILVI